MIAAGLACAAATWYYRTRPAACPLPPPTTVHDSRTGLEWYDPIEDDPVVQPIIALAGQEAGPELAGKGIYPRFGSCHSNRPTEKRILEEKYGIIGA